MSTASGLDVAFGAVVEAAAERGAQRALALAEDRIVQRVLAEIERRWPTADGWHTRAELASLLQISLDTLDRRIAVHDPSIEVQRVGRAVRVRLVPPVTEADIEEMAREAVSR